MLWHAWSSFKGFSSASVLVSEFMAQCVLNRDGQDHKRHVFQPLCSRISLDQSTTWVELTIFELPLYFCLISCVQWSFDPATQPQTLLDQAFIPCWQSGAQKWSVADLSPWSVTDQSTEGQWFWKHQTHTAHLYLLLSLMGISGGGDGCCIVSRTPVALRIWCGLTTEG